jgi:hypothetical protein
MSKLIPGAAGSVVVLVPGDAKESLARPDRVVDRPLRMLTEPEEGPCQDTRLGERTEIASGTPLEDCTRKRQLPAVRRRPLADNLPPAAALPLATVLHEDVPDALNWRLKGVPAGVGTHPPSLLLVEDEVENEARVPTGGLAGRGAFEARTVRAPTR